MITIKVYARSDKPEQVTLIELKNRRLQNIHEVTFLPVFKEHEVETLSYPTRQQMHSKRYYIKKHQTLVSTLSNSSLKEAIEYAHGVIAKNSLYANNA